MMLQSHHLAALVFALMATPAFLSARWLVQGRLPLPGRTGMNVRQKAVLDSKLARIMRMIGVTMLVSAAAFLFWGGQPRALLGVLLVMFLAINGLSAAAIVIVANARNRARPER